MIKKDTDENILFNIPDAKSIPCLTCKWGMHAFLAEYCLKYKIKPNEVYFENKDCEKYEPIE